MRTARVDRGRAGEREKQPDEHREALHDAIEEVQRIPEEERTNLAEQVSRDWGAEREADHIADDSVQRLESDAAPVQNGKLSPEMQGAMQQAAPQLEGLDQVHFDESAEASVAADSINALAFTRGSDVAVARGELTPEVAAHEAAHASLHADDGMVHAKLRGTYSALVNQGGGPKKGIGKALGGKTQWDKILDGVQAYETLETTLTKGGTPSEDALAAAKPQMIGTLRKVETDIAGWQKANNQTKEDKKARKDDVKQAKKKQNDDSGDYDKPAVDVADPDPRTKAPRRQAIAQLLPRVGTEKELLQSRDPQRWLTSMGLSVTNLTKIGKEVGGAKNRLREVTYETENGPFEGYFKAEQGAAKQEPHEELSGITRTDPNYGARSVAMYKLDKLFNAGVTARAEFATMRDQSGGTVLGTVLEKAKGVQMSDAKVAFSKGQQQQTPGSFMFDDPVFQRSLNKLSILDTICGQLDRHTGNYFVQVDESGKVTGVTGIDLDMSFGKDRKDDQEMGHAKKLPAQIDKEMGERILQVQTSDLVNALMGLLPMDEIQATVQRFNFVKEKVRELNSQGKLKNDWESGAWDGVTDSVNKFGFSSGRDSYKAVAASYATTNLGYELRDLVSGCVLNGSGPSPFKPGLLKTLDRFRDDKLREIVISQITGGVGENKGVIGQVLMEGALKERNADDLKQIALHMLNELLRDTTALAKVQAKFDERSSIGTSEVVTIFREAAASRWLPAALKMVKSTSAPTKPQGGGERKSMIGGSRGRK